MTRHSGLSVFLGVLLALSLGIGVLAGTLWFFGTDAGLLERWLQWDAVPASAGLTEADHAPVARLIADTMAGRQTVFQYRDLFSEQARVHMLDCAPLFALARTVGLTGFGLCFAALIGRCFLRSPRGTAVGMLVGVGVLLAAALILGVWGLIDFDGLFTAFHRVAFRNDLWLFPASDLLIRLMPLPFFVRYAAAGGGLWLACLLATAAVAGLLLKNNGKKIGS